MLLMKYLPKSRSHEDLSSSEQGQEKLGLPLLRGIKEVCSLPGSVYDKQITNEKSEAQVCITYGYQSSTM